MTLLLIISGIFTALTQMYDFLSPFAYISMVPLVYALIQAANVRLSFRKTYFIGVSFVLPYFITVFHWFWYLYPMEFMSATKLEAIGIILFCWLGLSALQGFTFACFALFFRQCSAHPALSPLLFGAVWTVSEWLQTLTWAGVPWARLALSQTNFLPAIQSASLFGSFFVTFLIALVNGILGWGLWQIAPNIGLKGNPIRQLKGALRPHPKQTLLRTTALALAVIFANLGFGLIRLSAYSDKPERKVTVALIQGNIASGEKWSGGALDDLRLYLSLSKEAAEQADLDIVLWPESVLIYAVKKYPPICSAIYDVAAETGAVFFVGAIDYVEGENYNAIIAFYPDGRVEEQPYYKQHPVPFGEYLPMEAFFDAVLPFLGELNLFSDPLTAGEDSAIADTVYGRVGRLVCFDSIYPNLARRSTSDGAEILLLSTNDSWYLDSPAVYQHNAHACLRAVENGRWVLRAANTGISSLISPTGEVTDYLDPLVQGTVIGDAYFCSESPLYSYIGDSFVLLCFAFMGFEAGSRIYRLCRKRRYVSL